MKLTAACLSIVIPFLIAAPVPASEPARLDTGTGVLYGTLELPTAARSAVPVVLLVAGSGPTDRDGNSALLPGHSDSLKMLAEALAARGIASLRYDKRAIAASRAAGLKESDLRFENYVDDAVQWGELLRKDKRFGPLFVAGHSEGSLIGMLAAHRLAATGSVSISGAGRPGGAIILDQLRGQPLGDGIFEQAEAAIHELEQGRTAAKTPAILFTLFRPSLQPYLISWFRYDPAREIAALAPMPVLILQGTTDIQVSVEEARRLKKANAAARLVVIEGMNHVLKEVPADPARQAASYGDPALPLAPRLVEEIARFVLRP